MDTLNRQPLFSSIWRNILNLIVLLLLAVILIEIYNKKSTKVEQPSVVHDTVWVSHDTTIYSKPTITETIPVIITSRDTQYLPDTSYVGLIKQYNELLTAYMSKNITKDSLKIDSIGYVKTIDTVFNNKIQSRSYSYSLKYPVVTKTVTLPPVSKLFVGGSLYTQGLQSGILYLDKKDHLYGANVGIGINGQLIYGVQSYWKLKLW